ncbi:MAG: hypothetical protein C0592_03855 [Marinilabiliales bacterium]|nr:MAG: hypothetical protein C0592_03855 [Marinilabiliales bacterium]
MYISDKEFSSKDFRSGFDKGNYEYCIFKNCNLNGVDISETAFIDCEFIDCDLSMANINKSAFRNVKFISSKLLGLQFNECNSMGLEFSLKDCIAHHCSFYQLKLQNSIFNNTEFMEADFAESDLEGSTFSGCDFSLAQFDHSNLELCDFRNATNYIIDPQTNRLKGAKFSREGLEGLVLGFGIEIV